MIEKNEILQMAQELSLLPETVEKDYVLGWMLHGIHQHGQLGSRWMFKGGTSLKKCFFETFRFSEDLDFTITAQDHMTVEFLRAVFNEIAEKLYEEIGIEFSKEMFRFKIVPKADGKSSAQGVVHYNSPIRGKPASATIKLDLTTDEIVVLNSEKKRVHHPYKDEPSDGIWAHCYSFEEVIAEKIRALVQRLRPRDVYDVVHFFRNRAMIKNPSLVCSVLAKKCSYKNIAIPTLEQIEKHDKMEELKSEWSNMLAHQLPNLPPLESFWQDIPPFFEWLNSKLNEQTLASAGKKDETVFQLGRVVNAYSVNPALQRIQFAAANRICIELRYHDKVRTVEPLSFRTASSGNRLFYGYEREVGHTKAYALEKIQGVNVTNIPYIEKYPVEISASGMISMPPIRRR